LRDDALAAVDTVRWVPDWGRQRIENMIENRPDWCISRQRTWGVPIALFAHRETGAPHPDSVRLMREVADRVESEGVDAWYKLDAGEMIGDDADSYDKVTDILDVWFDSGVTHHCVLAQREELRKPADLYLEGSDQHRGWFQSSLLTGVAMDGEAPYRQVLTHGFAVDAEGRKMSKSVGNVVAPQQIMKTLGADVLRLWVAAADYRYEMSVSEEILKRVSDSYRRIRNTARYLLGNLSDFDAESNSVAVEDCLPLDRWAVNQAARLQREIISAYDDYQFHLIYQKVHRFCSVDMSAFYLDVIKDRLYTTQADSLARRSAQTAMYQILEAMTRWLAPVLTFTAEEIWEQIPGDHSDTIFLDTWYDGLTIHEDESFDDDFWGSVLAVREAVKRQLEGLRKAGVIGSALAAEIDVFLPETLYQRLLPMENELRFVFITSAASIHPLDEAPDEAIEETAEDQAIRVSVRASSHQKCERCWHQRPDVGMVSAHPNLCGRCVVNVIGKGEARYYA
jgi:isoleucyl-tRNA synthetase